MIVYRYIVLLQNWYEDTRHNEINVRKYQNEGVVGNSKISQWNLYVM